MHAAKLLLLLALLGLASCAGGPVIPQDQAAQFQQAAAPIPYNSFYCP